MTDIFNSLSLWLHEVFVAQWDGWIVLGFVAQACFTMRFIVQWLASEKAKRSVMPVAFWFFSLLGGTLLLIYAIQRKDPVFIAGQGLGLVVYIRNLWLIANGKKRLAAEK
ncbi:lipid-A-disaccharide synthase N-terminal domain-containing protein [Brucella inopinata]|uniref:Lipid-A-disaccharide synthase N-terminal domain-containing protein n=1 Tax=Brucella inopinata TaxID=1218315 RepID=A0AAW7B0X4_9HYPH|nr:lipid-A-disaccharide synthase N-terminal domain-containing protein [Brucella inopinata]EFM55370.1 lipid A biosynthesis [Brucella inopinata BO1]KEY04287.1 membrane protein [Brucella suis bv. 4 str. 40]MDL2332432.1 lipid-A-disaccharide synthase N-terminal domain-containing protein [Brucella inopinata]